MKHRAGENPARLKGNIDVLLPRVSKIKRVKHHRALPWPEMPDFMQRLRARNGTGARALEFAILTAARSGEVRAADWSEIDLDARLWTIPGEKMKGGKTHRVPLSQRAVALLESLPNRTGLVFPAIKGGTLSDMTLSKVLRDMDVDAVPHGFRASFRTWAQEQSNVPEEAAELSLAHVNNDATRAAYARGEMLEQRTVLMQQWAQYLDGANATNEGRVIALKGRHA
jgi:integrase